MKVADRSGTVLKEIVQNVVKVSDLVNEIAHASQEQASGLSQISKAMNQLDQATQGNAASAEETASSSEQMAAEAEMLNKQVRELVFIVEGRHTQAQNHAKAPRAPSSRRPTNVIPMAAPKAKASPISSQSENSSAENLIPFGEEEEKLSNLGGF
jgi:methyl-accepting chemotaxis protein